jgi:3-deoxy-manno-octulosonate cytidylyltransferase (CMP-KDO synthetase)
MGTVDFKVVIPARYASTRLPGKSLRLMAGRPMLQHVCERANESSAQEVVVATDDQRIADAASGFNVTVCMTSEQHTSGTERLAEVVEQLGWSDDTLVVNLQGDEPAMPEGYALYFSRAPIPWHRDDSGSLANAGDTPPVLHHIGLYAYRAHFLRHFSELEHSPLEHFEKLEQLRALWHGLKIHVGISEQLPASGVDTEADLLRVEKLL